jgi:hypothetical protein
MNTCFMNIAVRGSVTALSIALSFGGLAMPLIAIAADNACLMEGKIVNTEIKDCLQGNDINEAALKRACENLSKLVVRGGGRITYVAACPAKAQGSCIGFLGQPVTVFYYNRSADSLADAKKSCIAAGSKWVD